MKTKKNRIVLSAVSVLLVFSLLVGGTMAWFTDTEKVNANFTAGVLDIEVNPGEDGYTTTEPLEFENLRPMWYENFYKELEPKIAFGNELDNNVAANGMQDSDYRPVPVYFKPLQIENRGTLPTKVEVSVNLGDPCEDGEEKIELSEDKNTVNWAHEKNGNCTNGLQQVLKIFIYKQEAGSWKRIENVNLNKLYDDAVADPDGVAEHNTALETADTYTTAMIPAGEKATYVVAGYLPETVGNEYQGKHYHADVMFNAYQMDDNAGGGDPDSGSSEKPEDPDRFNDNVTIEWHEGTALAGSKTITMKSSGTVSASDYAAPAGYVYSPAAAEQSTDVTVDDKSGDATPNKVIFTVERTEKVVTVKYNDTKGTVDASDDVILTETQSVALKNPGEYYIAAANASDQAGKTRVSVPAIPVAGYVFDDDTQAYDVTVGNEDVTPTEVTFNVKLEEQDQEKEINVEWWCIDASHEENYNPDNPAEHKNDHTAGTASYKFLIKEGETKSISTVDIGAPGNGYYVDPAPQSTLVTFKDGILVDENDQKIDTVRFTVKVQRDADYTLGGNGTALHPYVVSDEFELSRIRNHMASHFRVVKDISLEGYSWTPISTGSSTAPSSGFSGVIDGQGHTISGMNVSLPSNIGGAGFVAYNRGGTIKNLNFTNARVKAGFVLGTIAGQNTGLIENCHVDTYIYGTSRATVALNGYQYRGTFAGGIVGVNGGTIRNCTADGELYAAYNFAHEIAGANVGTIE